MTHDPTASACRHFSLLSYVAAGSASLESEIPLIIERNVEVRMTFELACARKDEKQVYSILIVLFNSKHIKGDYYGVK